MISMNLQDIHDRLMGVMPEDANHPENCPICNGEYAAFIQGGNVSDTYTQEEVDALVAAAIAPLHAELTEFRAGQRSAEVDAQIAAVRTEMETQVEELTSKLDAAVLEAEAAKAERDEIKQWLEAEAARVIAEAELAGKRDERITQVAAVVSFPEEYVAERADKWASLSDEDFEALLADYKAIGEKTAKASGSGSELPKATAMVASRQDAGTSKVGSAVLELISSREDPRAIR